MVQIIKHRKKIKRFKIFSPQSKKLLLISSYTYIIKKAIKKLLRNKIFDNKGEHFNGYDMLFFLVPVGFE